MNGIGKEKSSRQTEMKNTHTQILESCDENRMHNMVWPMSKTTSKNVAIFLRFGFFSSLARSSSLYSFLSCIRVVIVLLVTIMHYCLTFRLFVGLWCSE